MTHYRHGTWQNGEGEPLELFEPESEVYDGHPADDAPETAEDKPKRTRSAKKDPRESKGAQ